jgi:uncharacterized membrane protein YccC
MKKAAFISGTLVGSLTSLGVLFEIQHWPGASIMLVLGLGICAVIFIPSAAKYLYDKNN